MKPSYHDCMTAITYINEQKQKVYSDLMSILSTTPAPWPFEIVVLGQFSERPWI